MAALLEFGPYRLDPRRKVLWRGGEVVPLTPRALEVLAALAEGEGRVVTKEELLRTVWPDTFVEEANLSVNVSAIRKALGAQPDGRPYVETLSRRGYRFVAPVRRRDAEGPRSLAVLPFAVLGEADDTLGLGMADAVITRLGRIGELMVRPTGAVLAHGGREPVQAGRELGVEAVLEGQVQREGARVRLRARLLRVEDGRVFWAETLEEEAAGLFLLQDTLAERLAGALALTLHGAQREALRSHPTDDPEAWRAYLKGRYFWNKLTGAWLAKAREAYRVAVDRDPAFARAWAGLSDTLTMLCLFGLLDPAEAWPRARQAAERAVEGDPALAEGHVSLAYVKLFQGWDWAGAEAGLRHAVALAPASAEAHQWSAVFLAMSGRFEEAGQAIVRAQELDPLSLTASTNAGLLLYLRQQYEPEVEAHRRTLELEPDYAPAHWALGLAHEQTGDFDAAVAELRRAVELTGSPLIETNLARTYALAARPDEARALLAALEARPGGISPYRVAVVRAALGERAEAFAALERALAERDHWMVWLGVDPGLEPLRDDARFEELLRQVGPQAGPGRGKPA
jgi:DNA-binding winged helix-turn-helix (wHTH) protein/Flp pilus assembly protein TadD